ncbi:hypothetical protein [uncultured Pseudomonas sp.]|uniref:hypothetical protein n=1 Tax=uncultured Pseudomonas sp. TaxID=114707 RepID=UPI0030D94080|tara:strand:- start:123 stop:761 length:639 start_codon:yes stop_codon:yes gene_type:complete
MAIDKDDYKAGVLEQVAGNPAMSIGTAAIAAGFAATTPVAVFLPVLAGSMAGIRHSKRLERFITDVSADLAGLDERLNGLEDSQYQVISDALVSALHSLDHRKLDYLRLAIRNALDVEIDPAHSAFVARAIRDISAEEADFLFKIPLHTGIAFFESPPPGFMAVDPNSTDGDAVEGLLSLGLLHTVSGYGGSTMSLTRNAKVVCQLLDSPES